MDGMDSFEKAKSWKNAHEDLVVTLVMIRHHSGKIALQDARRHRLESHIDPKGPKGRIACSMSLGQRGDHDNARRLAVVSGQSPYYGRIVSSNVASKLAWKLSVG
jgi:hypothetical protein